MLLRAGPTKSWISPVLEIPHPLWILSPLLNCAHSEIFFPCVSLEFPLLWLKPCVSCLVSFHCPLLWGAGLHLLSLRQLWTAVTSSLSCCFWLSRAVSLSFSSREEEQCASPQPPWWPTVGLHLVCQHLHCVCKPKAGHCFPAVATAVLGRGEGSPLACRLQPCSSSGWTGEVPCWLRVTRCSSAPVSFPPELLPSQLCPSLHSCVCCSSTPECSKRGGINILPCPGRWEEKRPTLSTEGWYLASATTTA